MHATAGRNRLGVLAIALAVISIFSYVGEVVLSAYVGIHPGASLGKLGILGFLVSPLAAIASAAIGIAALLRARRGAGGLGPAIVGFLFGALLTLAFAAWFIGLMLSPRGWGD